MREEVRRSGTSRSSATSRRTSAHDVLAGKLTGRPARRSRPASSVAQGPVGDGTSRWSSRQAARLHAGEHRQVPLLGRTRTRVEGTSGLHPPQRSEPSRDSSSEAQTYATTRSPHGFSIGSARREVADSIRQRLCGRRVRGAIGRWLTRSRADLMLYVKGCHPPFCSPSLVHTEVEKARSALGLESLPVFILHRDDATVSVSALRRGLADRGRARHGFKPSESPTGRFERFRALQAELGADASARYGLQQPILTCRDGHADLARVPLDDDGGDRLAVHATG